MSTEMPPYIAARLAVLERQLRVLRIMVVALAASLVIAAATSLSAQAPRSLDDRVAELERRVAAGAGGATRIKAPFEVTDAAGKVVVRVTTDGSLVVGNPAGAAVAIGVGANSNAGAVLLRSATADTLAIGRYGNGPSGFHVLGADGQDAASLAVDTEGDPSLRVGKDSAGGVYVGVGTSKAGAIAVRRTDGQAAVAMGSWQQGPLGVTVLNENGKPSASLTGDAKGGVLKVFNPAGTAVGGLLASDTGGSLSLTGPSGGRNAVSLSSNASGGKVQVFPTAGGPAQAELTADASGGGVTLYTRSGSPAGTLYATQSGSGRLEINQNSQVMVEAGTLPSGVGVVRAGPSVGGSTGSLDTPFAIMGRKGK